MPVHFDLKDGKVVSVWTDTIAEANEFWRTVNEGPARSNQQTDGKKPKRELPEKAKQLLRLLTEHADGVPGKEIADNLGVDAKGLGPVVIPIRKWAADMNFVKKDVIVKGRRRDGDAVLRTLRLGDKFLKFMRDRGLEHLG